MADNHDNKQWQAEVSDLLTRAAELCVEQGVELDPFMRGAYSAYVESRPGMKEHLERLADRRLEAELEALRASGKVASA